MEFPKPDDLNMEQWNLLKYLHRFHSPFHIDDVFTAYQQKQIPRVEFYKMVFWLALLNYIAVFDPGVIEPHQKVNPSYLLTLKGKRAIATFAEGQHLPFQ